MGDLCVGLRHGPMDRCGVLVVEKANERDQGEGERAYENRFRTGDAPRR